MMIWECPKTGYSGTPPNWPCIVGKAWESDDKPWFLGVPHFQTNQNRNFLQKWWLIAGCFAVADGWFEKPPPENFEQSLRKSSSHLMVGNKKLKPASSSYAFLGLWLYIINSNSNRMVTKKKEHQWKVLFTRWSGRNRTGWTGKCVLPLGMGQFILGTLW